MILYHITSSLSWFLIQLSKQLKPGAVNTWCMREGYPIKAKYLLKGGKIWLCDVDQIGPIIRHLHNQDKPTDIVLRVDVDGLEPTRHFPMQGVYYLTKPVPLDRVTVYSTLHHEPDSPKLSSATRRTSE